MEIRVLGPLEVLSEGQPIDLGGPKQRAALGVLVARAGERLSGDYLLDEVYGDDASPRAKRSIQTFVSNLRREMGDMIRSDRRGYVLVVDRDSIDAARFDRLRSEGSRLIESDPVDASEVLRAALELWRGHPYADIDTRGVIAAEAARLSQTRLDALELRIEADLAVGRHLELISELEALTSEHPLRERFRAQHMLALYRAGRQSDALRAYTKTRTVLAEELGIEPSSELQTLEMQILDQDPSLIVSVTSVVERLAVLAAEHTVVGATVAERDEAAKRRDHLFAERTAANGGEVIDVRRHTVYARFPSVALALQAAARLPANEFRVAVDFGAVDVTDGAVSGPPVSRALRLAAVAHSGQVIVTDDAQRSLADGGGRGWTLQMLGRFEIHGVGDGLQLFQLAGPDRTDRPPLLLGRLPPPLPERPTGAIAGYELREVLGEGTTGLVYRAYQASIGREVAVRVVRPDVVDDLRFIRRFESEMQRILDLTHPSIVSVIDFWRDPSAAFVVSRLVQHPSLAVVADGVERPETLGLILRVAEAIDHGHAAGIVHGRIRPHNLRVGEDGVPYILDFGIASLFGDLVQYPADAYTAPEAIGGLPTTAADVYALAVLSAEILSGRRVPLDGNLPITGTRADPVIERSTRSEPSERHPDVASFIADLADGSAPGSARHRREMRNPYKGLASFTEVDAADFHGRGELVDKLVDAVEHKRTTVVVGSSGIGKSSVVLAGVVPRLRRSANRLVAIMTPGAHPFDALTEALDGVAVVDPGRHVAAVAETGGSLAQAAAAVIPSKSELLLVIDQFEELFTLASNQERKAFLSAIAENGLEPISPLTVIATMRADFYDRPLDHPEFGQLVAANTVALHAPTPDGWKALIAAPARRVGIAVDDTLVEAIIDDAEAEPGALALAQHALTQMFGDRQQDRLTLDAYRRAGGLAGWIGRTAERIYETLSEAEKSVARMVFVRLVAVNEETEDTRRRLRRFELDAADLHWPSVQAVMEGFVANRLVVVGRDAATRQPTIEIAHEALIHRWARLASWIDEAREDLLVARRIELAAADWIAADRSDEFLYRGSRLERAEAWSESNASLVSPSEALFLAESRRAVDRESENLRRRRNRVLTVLAAALAISLTLAGLAWMLRGRAELQAVENRVLRLIRDAQAAPDDDPELALLLALEAHDLAAELDPATQGELATVLHMATQGSRLAGYIPDPQAFVEASPDGRLLLTDAGDDTGDIVVYDQITLEELMRFDAGGGPGEGAFSPDGSEFAFAPRSGPSAVRIFDTKDFGELAAAPEPCCLIDPRFSSDGSWVGAFDEAGSVFGWERSTATEFKLGVPFEPWPRWLPSDEAIVYGREHEGTELLVHDIGTGEVTSLQTFPISGIGRFDLHPSGEQVVLVGDDEIQYWTLGAVEPEWSISGAGLLDVEMSPDGRWVALSGANRQVLVVDVGTEEAITLTGHAGGVAKVSFSAKGDRIYVLQAAGGVKVWDLTPDGRPELQNIATSDIDRALPVWTSSDGERVVIVEFSGPDARVTVYGTSTGHVVGQSRSYVDRLLGPVASHSGEYAGGVLADGTGVVEHIATGELIFAEPGMVPWALSDDGRFGGFLGDSPTGEPWIHLIDLAEGSEIADWPTNRTAIGPDGTPSEGLIAYPVTPTFDAIEIRSLEDGRVLAKLQAGPIHVINPGFSPDGRHLAFGSENGGGFVVDVKEVRAGRPLEEATVMRAIVESGPTPVAVAGGAFAATTHSGDTLRIWRLATGEEWATIPISTSERATRATFTADGRYLYYQARDDHVARMPLDIAELATLARSSVFRDFSQAECERYDITDDCTSYAASGDSSG